MPDVDILLLTHDHWDHLDHQTVVGMKPKVKHIITGLGVGEHLEQWGFPASMITEMDWFDETSPRQGFKVTATPARHFSGRSFKRNVSLWSSFVLQTLTMKIYIGGDSGYDDHFGKIGAQYGPFDLAILECGQYNHKWRYIHMLPEELVPAAQDLQARHLMIVHWAKFPLSEHDWNEPPTKVTSYARQAGMPLVTPMIGEKVELNMLRKDWPEWWAVQGA
jgi:L-ascorbate metabolism protein UlaG (beta-lactamase superfamily)